MRKRNFFLALGLFILLAVPAYAESLESVRVVKFWHTTNDMVVERDSGEKLLLQHNPTCSTMSTEFPIQVLWTNNKITQAKVASNEQCKVYNYGPYSSDLIISKRIPSSNALTTEHLAEVDWNGARYQVDYGDGCKYLREFEGSTAYVYTPKSGLEGATLYLPTNRGQCGIKSATLLQTLTPASSVTESPIKNLVFKAENNQILFTWDAFPEGEPWLVLVTYSKFKMNPNDYTLEQLPNLKRSRLTNLKIAGLINDKSYYFYVTARNGAGDLAPWKEIPITPVRTTVRIVNHPDPELFTVNVTETADTYHLSWTDKSTLTKKYMVLVYVNGKREILEFTPGTQNYFDIAKKPEWKAVNFRATVRSLPTKPAGLWYFDGVFWKKS